MEVNHLRQLTKLSQKMARLWSRKTIFLTRSLLRMRKVLQRLTSKRKLKKATTLMQR